MPGASNQANPKIIYNWLRCTIAGKARDKVREIQLIMGYCGSPLLPSNLQFFLQRDLVSCTIMAGW